MRFFAFFLALCAVQPGSGLTGFTPTQPYVRSGVQMPVRTIRQTASSRAGVFSSLRSQRPPLSLEAQSPPLDGDKSSCSRGFASSLRRPAAVVVGSVSAYLLQHSLSLSSPLVAPVIVGLISAAAIAAGAPLSPYQAPLYCGAFAGTTSTAIMANLPAISILSVVVVIMFEMYERKGLFPGKGGRLGACATMSSAVMTLLVSKLKLFSELRALAVPPFNVASTMSSALSPFAYASAGAIACTALRRRSWTPVTASAALGSVGTLAIGGPLGGFFYAGSFIGMSANAANKEEASFKSQVLAAALLALFFQTFGQNILAGVGGKLGAAACAACVTRDKLQQTFKGGSRIKLSKPSRQEIDRFLHNNRGAAPNHDLVGCTKEEKTLYPPGFTTIALSSTFEDCSPEAFTAASDAIRRWDVFKSTSNHIAVDKEKSYQMATLAKSSILPLWVMQPIARSYVTDLSSSTAVAYHTQKGHLLRGEERLSCAYDKETRRLSLELRSVSRGAGILGKLLFSLPMSKSMQSNFFHAQMDRITDIVETNQFLLDTSFEAALPPKNTTLAYVI